MELMKAVSCSLSSLCFLLVWLIRRFDLLWLCFFPQFGPTAVIQALMGEFFIAFSHHFSRIEINTWPIFNLSESWPVHFLGDLIEVRLFNSFVVFLFCKKLVHAFFIWLSWQIHNFALDFCLFLYLLKSSEFLSPILLENFIPLDKARMTQRPLVVALSDFVIADEATRKVVPLPHFAFDKTSVRLLKVLHRLRIIIRKRFSGLLRLEFPRQIVAICSRLRVLQRLLLLRVGPIVAGHR